MGRGGAGVFDSDMAWDDASDLSPLIGIDLSSAGCGRNSDTEEDDPPVLSIKDSAAYLDDGNFTRVFNQLRSDRRHYELVLFVLLSMRVGAKIGDKHKRFIKKKYKTTHAWDHLSGSRAQIRVALKEYKSGEPYTLKYYDSEDSQAEDPPPSTDSEKEDVGCTTKVVGKTSKKRCRDCKEDSEQDKIHVEEEEEPNSKRAKTTKAK